MEGGCILHARLADENLTTWGVDEQVVLVFLKHDIFKNTFFVIMDFSPFYTYFFVMNYPGLVDLMQARNEF